MFVDGLNLTKESLTLPNSYMIIRQPLVFGYHCNKENHWLHLNIIRHSLSYNVLFVCCMFHRLLYLTLNDDGIDVLDEILSCIIGTKITRYMERVQCYLIRHFLFLI